MVPPPHSNQTVDMARPKLKDLPDLSDFAHPGAKISVVVTPGAAATELIRRETCIRIKVIAAPEKGKANAAVRAVLAGAMGVAPSRLTLVRGQTSRTKLFRYSGSD